MKWIEWMKGKSIFCHALCALSRELDILLVQLNYAVDVIGTESRGARQCGEDEGYAVLRKDCLRKR